MQRYENSVLYQGQACLRVAPGAEIYVYEAGTLTPATVFETNDHTPLANPFKADSRGTFFFYAEDGAYDIRVVSPGRPEQWSKDVILQDLVSGGALVHQEDIQVKGGLIAPPAGWEDVPSVGQPNGAGPLNAQAVSLAARTSALKYKTDQIVSVRDYITTAIDGETSNQDGIVAAVSHCFTNGLTLFWPGGQDYVSTDTIPNFHNVQHIGTGRLRRGSNVFYISPDKTQTNTVYAAPTGGASGFDGLTADRPVASVEQAIEILKSHPTGVLCGNWDIQLLPGRFTQGVRIQDFPTSRAKVRIMGSVDHEGNPLTIFDGASSSRFEAINVVLGAAKVSYHNLRFENWRHSTGGGVGIQHRYGGEVDIVDCEFYDCDSGVFVFEQRLRCFGGLFEDCDYGLRASYQSNFTTYVSDSETSKYPRPFFKNCVESAVIASRGTIGHLDYIDSQDGKRMLTLGESSRVHVMGCSAKRHTLTAVLCRGSSQWLDDPAVPNNFHMGTADACACIAQHEGGSRETRVHGQDRGEQAYRQMTFTDLITHTGTTGLTPLSSGGNSFIARVPPYYFADVRKKISVQLNGTLTGSAGSKTFGLYSSGVEIHTLTVPAGLSGGYVVEWDIHAQAASQQRVLAKLLIDGQPAVIKSATTNVSLSTVELLLNVRVQLSDAADTIIVRRVESFITG